MAENEKGGEDRKLDEAPEGGAVYIVDGAKTAPDGKPVKAKGKE